jgi:hypothetical protein
LVHAIWNRRELFDPIKNTTEKHLRRWRKVIDFHTTQARGHRQNIERYCSLLATELTELERQYLHKRIAEEYAQLERLQGVKSQKN